MFVGPSEGQREEPCFPGRQREPAEDLSCFQGLKSSSPMGSRARATPLPHPAVPWEVFLRVLSCHWGQPLFRNRSVFQRHKQRRVWAVWVVWGEWGLVNLPQPGLYFQDCSRGLHTAVPQSAQKTVQMRFLNRKSNKCI